MGRKWEWTVFVVLFVCSVGGSVVYEKVIKGDMEDHEVTHLDDGEGIEEEVVEDDEGDIEEDVEEEVEENSIVKDAMLYIESNNPTHGVDILRQEVQNENFEAAYQPGLLHLYGRHVEQDFQLAADYFKMSAGHGYPAGQRMYAFMLETGRGVPADHSLGLLHYHFAARGGDMEARAVLGSKYHRGDGVHTNCATSMNYYRSVAHAVASEITETKLTWPLQINRLSDEYLGDKSTDVVQYYQYAADTGDSTAQLTMGTVYLQGGFGLERDFKEAMRYFKLAAAQDLPIALTYIGFLYMMGYGVEQDYQLATKYFIQASSNPLALAYRGEMYMYGIGMDANINEAVRLLKRSSELGNSYGKVLLGNCYFKGKGVAKDYAEAYSLYTDASVSRNVVALFNLAQMHRMGLAVSKSCGTAVSLFKQVVEHGNMSRFESRAYDSYEAEDISNALIDYERAGLMGFEVAQSNAAYLLDTMKREQTEEADTVCGKALEYFRKSAEQNNPMAYLKMGDYYYYGCGVDKDVAKAASYYRIASEKYQPQALFNLGYMHQYGIGLEQDFYLAKRYYDEANQMKPEARLPATLALVGLGIHFIWSGEYEWPIIPYEEWDTDTVLILLFCILLVVVGIFRLRLTRRR